MSRYRKVQTRVWTDEKFRRLSAPRPNARDLWLYLLCGPRTCICPGLVVARVAVMADDLGWPARPTEKCLAEIVDAGMARADRVAGLVWLVNALNQPEHAPASPSVVVARRREFDELPDCALRDEYGEAAAVVLSRAESASYLSAWTTGKCRTKPPGGKQTDSQPAVQAAIQTDYQPAVQPGVHQDQDQDQDQEQEQKREEKSAPVGAAPAGPSPTPPLPLALDPDPAPPVKRGKATKAEKPPKPPDTARVAAGHILGAYRREWEERYEGGWPGGKVDAAMAHAFAADRIGATPAQFTPEAVARTVAAYLALGGREREARHPLRWLLQTDTWARCASKPAPLPRPPQWDLEEHLRQSQAEAEESRRVCEAGDARRAREKAEREARIEQALREQAEQQAREAKA